MALDKDLVLKTLDRNVRVELKAATYGKECSDGKRNSGSSKQKGTEMKDGIKEKKIMKLYENLNTEDTLTLSCIML